MSSQLFSIITNISETVFFDLFLEVKSFTEQTLLPVKVETSQAEFQRQIKFVFDQSPFFNQLYLIAVVVNREIIATLYELSLELKPK